MSKPDAKLITGKTNIAYLSNFTGSSGFMLLTGSTKYLFTDFRYTERAKETIKKGIKIIEITRDWKEIWQKILQKHKVKTLGVEESDLTVSRLKRFKKLCGKKIKFTDISGQIETIREIKAPEEIKLIIQSQRIKEKVFLEIKKIIATHVKSNSKTPLRESDLAWKIKELGHKFGAEDMSFDPIIAFGQHTARPHHEPDQTNLKKGDLVLVDMGMKYKGYCSDMTRMLFTATPTKKQAEIYTLVLKAQKNAITHIKAGITGQKADALTRDLIKKAGYGDRYGHSAGHGVGLDIHETPSLAESCKKPLRANTVVTVEPGIYLEGDFGVRIEDMVLVTKTGCKNLTKIKKELKDCII